MKTSEKKKHVRSKWKIELLVPIYELARSGMKNTTIARTLGTNLATFKLWMRKYPVLAQALKQAREAISSSIEDGGSFRNYVYKRLPSKVKDYWDKLFALEEDPKGMVKQINILNSCSKNIRQHLFFFALVHFAFNPSEACRFINITSAALHAWCEDDPKFRELMDEIHWHKANFYEGGLVKLVAKGDSAATIFANKTFNRDRGYNDKVSVEVSGTVNQGISLDELEALSLDDRKRILAALRTKKEQLLGIENKSDVVDADFEER